MRRRVRGVSGAGSGCRLRARPPRRRCISPARLARLGWLGHGAASPVVHAGGTPLGQRPGEQRRAIAPSQNVCTIGSGRRIGSTISAPQMMPSTPMKRVSRPTRIALRQITTQPRPSASEARPIACVPGMPISWAATSSDDWPMSSARSTVCGAVEEARDLRRGPDREHHGGDRAEQAARRARRRSSSCGSRWRGCGPPCPR